MYSVLRLSSCVFSMCSNFRLLFATATTAKSTYVTTPGLPTHCMLTHAYPNVLHSPAQAYHDKGWGIGDTSPGSSNLFRERGFTKLGPQTCSRKRAHEAFLFSPFWAASSRYIFFCFPLHCLDSMSGCLGRIISNAFSKRWLV